jgi:peptidoglycan/xylan/chitin deacetylase (PgdA/CDA1 family)
VRGRRARVALVAGVIALGCSPTHLSAGEGSTAAPPASIAPAVIPSRAARPQLDGRSFPDKVLALTWDDGPDAGTLELARYLHREGVSATFFVVGAWMEDVSDEPGQGSHVFETGHEVLPILGELVALGHRLGNHTLHHVILSDASPGLVAGELRDNQRALDPFQDNQLRLFRVPGGAWSATASAIVDADPELSRLVGPVRWDVDGKDWEGSLYCRSSIPAAECERAAPGGGSRVEATVMAQRYVSGVDAVGHGIVLLHDRVGHVGSDYALRVAEALIPALQARGYVFAAPILRFSPLAAHHVSSSEAGSIDVDGDHRADRCERRAEGVFCALVKASGGFGASRRWSVDGDFAEYPDTIRFGDINGDGRADVCGRSREGLACALSNGRSFTRATIWLPEMSNAAGWAPYGPTIELVDVNGDGRADVCAEGPDGSVCALAP